MPPSSRREPLDIVARLQLPDRSWLREGSGRTAGGAPVATGPPQPSPEGTALRVDLPLALRGVYMVPFDVPWPPAPDEPKLPARVVGAMRGEPNVVLIERTSSGVDAVGARLSIRISGTQLMASDSYGASGADDVRRLPGDPTLTQLTLYLPGSYTWARLWADGAYRIQREEIVTPGHLIERTAFAYDQAPHARHRRSDVTTEGANAHRTR